MTIKTSGKMKEISTLKEKTLKEELKEALINDTFYDFISNNFYKFTKEELCEIIKEYDFARYQLESNRFYGILDFINLVIGGLEENGFFEEE